MFEDVCKLAVEQRPAFLDSTCVDDPGLRKAVEALIACDPGPTERLDGPTRLTVAASGSAEPQQSAPPVLKDYELLRCIGGGGMGQVWLARNRHDLQFCAVKLFRADMGVELQGLREYKHRVAEHPHLVPIEHVGEEGDWFYCVMPLADDATAQGPVLDIGRYEPLTLALALERRGALPIDDVLEVGRHVLAALAHLHERGARHADVKPANIIKLRGQWRLADHGLVSNLDQSAAGHTPGFCPPEGPGGRSADLYALAVTLFVIATNEQPRRLEALRIGELALRDDDARAADLAAVIRRACAPEAASRFDRAANMADALAKIGEVPRRPWWRTWPTAAALMGLVGVLALAGVFLNADRPPHVSAPSANVPIVDCFIEAFEGTSTIGRRVGEGLTTVHLNDQLDFEVTFAEPAYHMLFAMPANGAGPTYMAPPEGAAPQPSMTVSNGWELEDHEGQGLYAFILIASREPLPSPASVAQKLRIDGWADRTNHGSGAFDFDGKVTHRLGETRGPTGPRTTTPPAFAELTRRLSEVYPQHSVRAIAVSVVSREE